MSGEDDVFSDEAAVVQHSGGSGGIAALIAQTRHTGQLKDIAKKDNKTHFQRILSVPEHSAQSPEGSKVTYRSSESVSPSSRNVKCSSVLVLSQSKSPLLPPSHMTSDPSSPSSGISSMGTEDTPTTGDTSPNQSDNKRRESNKPVPKPRLIKQSTRGADPSTKEFQVENLKNENGQYLEEQQLESEKMEKKSLRSQSDNTDGQASKPIPVPRSTRNKTQSDSEPKPETPQSLVPKPRSASKLISTVQNDEKAKAVKTLQALLPTVSKPKEELLGPDGLTRTERSLLQMQKLLNEDTLKSDTMDTLPSSDTTAKDTTSNKPKPPRTRTTVSESSPPQKDVGTEARPPSKSVSEDKDSTVGAADKQTFVKVASVAVKTSKPVVESKEKSPSPARENAPPQGIRPSPPRTVNSVSSQETIRPSLPTRENAPPQGIRPSPPRTVNSEETNRPSATQGSPSSGSMTTTDTDTRVSQTPKEPTKVLPARPTPPARSLKPPQKTIQIKEDFSWIKRRDSVEKYDSRTALSTSQTMPDLTPGPMQVRKPLPFRSHAIITPTTPSSGLAYTPPILNSDPKLPSNSKPFTASGLKFNRSRAGTVRGNDESEEAAKNKRKRNNSFTRSTSDDNIASKVTDEGKGKSKKQGPPKKPPRVRMLKTSSDTRPISMIEASPNDRRDKAQKFTSSCLVGTMPRDLPEDSTSPKRGRKDSKSKPEKKGFLGRIRRNKTQYMAETPTLHEEPDEETDSSSDDEKGGTISRMPRLRHVTPKSKSMDLDDAESEYHQLFEYVFVVGLKDKGKGALDTEVTYTFPPAPEQVFSGKDAALLAIPQFCFPDIDQWKPTKSYKSESFSFVLTDMMGGRRFGYCRRLLPSGKGLRLPEVYCIVSPLGCFSLYEKILDEVEERRAVSSSAVFTFLKAIQANPFPRPGRSVEVRAFGARGAGLETVVLTRPMDSRLEHINFSLLFSTLSPRKIIQIFSSLLLERRVILCANSLSLLSGCAHALLALLYPFEWQHVFIPVLPNSLIEFVCSPLPYIIGINPSLIKELDSMEMEEALVIDLEKKKFVLKIGDETSILPTKLYQYLEHSLSSSVVSGEYLKKGATSTRRADEIVVNTFMTFFAYLYGDYKAYMKPVKAEKEFQRPEFIATFSSKSTKRFLEAFQMSQLFENFIEQRENPAKEATTAQTHFEQQLPVLKPRCRDIEIFSSKSRFDRWKLAKGMKKK